MQRTASGTDPRDTRLTGWVYWLLFRVTRELLVFRITFGVVSTKSTTAEIKMYQSGNMGENDPLFPSPFILILIFFKYIYIYMDRLTTITSKDSSGASAETLWLLQPGDEIFHQRVRIVQIDNYKTPVSRIEIWRSGAHVAFVGVYRLIDGRECLCVRSLSGLCCRHIQRLVRVYTQSQIVSCGRLIFVLVIG